MWRRDPGGRTFEGFRRSDHGRGRGEGRDSGGEEVVTLEGGDVVEGVTS